MFRHKEKMNAKKIKVLALIYFLFGFSEAIFVYVMSPYLKEITGSDNVGIFYFFSYVLILAAILNFHKAIGQEGRMDVFYKLLIAKMVCVAVLLFSPSGALGIIFMILYIISNALAFVNLDMILEMYSKDSYSGRIRGSSLTALNIGFLIGPLVSTAFLSHGGFPSIFIALIILTFVIFLISVGYFKKDAPLSARGKRMSIWKIVKKTWQRKDIVKIFHISFALEFFYALVAVYYTLYLLEIGFSWGQIGIILTAALLPFVLFQYAAGHLADRKFGEKGMLIGAVLLLGTFTAIIWFLDSQNILVWCILMFLARVGAALIEILRDSYFYKRIDARDVDVIDIFRTSMPAAFISFSIVSAALLLFFPLKIVFVLTAVVVLSALYPAWRLENNRANRF